MPHPVQSAATTGAYLAATAAAAQTHANTTHHLQEQDPDSSRRTLRPTLYLPTSTQILFRLPSFLFDLSTFSFTNPHTYLPTLSPTHFFTNPLPTNLPTNQPTNQPTYLPTYHPFSPAKPVPSHHQLPQKQKQSEEPSTVHQIKTKAEQNNRQP